MKNQFKYYVVGNYIIRLYSWRAKTGKLNVYHETEKALFDRAKKYGYIPVTID